MHDEVYKLRRKLLDVEAERREIIMMIEGIERDCHHDWGGASYAPLYTEAHTIPGDPPGTMGVDRQLPCHVPAKTTPRWARQCKKCGLAQTTTRAAEKTEKVPKW